MLGVTMLQSGVTLLCIRGHHVAVRGHVVARQGRVVFQLSGDPDPFYTFTVLDTPLFTVTSDQFIALNSDVLDYETTPVITFGVSHAGA